MSHDKGVAVLTDCAGNDIQPGDAIIAHNDLLSASQVLLPTGILVSNFLNSGCPSKLIGPACAVGIASQPFVNNILLGVNASSGNPEWQRKPTTLTHVNSGDINVTTSGQAGINVFMVDQNDGAIAVSEPSNECDSDEIVIKNLNVAPLTITATGSSIDGGTKILAQNEFVRIKYSFSTGNWYIIG